MPTAKKVEEKQAPEKPAREVKVEKEALKQKIEHMTELVHKAFLAGLGGISLAHEEVEKFVKRAIERGEVSEKEGKKLARELIEKTKKKGDASAKKSKLSQKVKSAFPKLNLKIELPSKKDFEELNSQINELNKKVDQLLQRKT